MLPLLIWYLTCLSVTKTMQTYDEKIGVKGYTSHLDNAHGFDICSLHNVVGRPKRRRPY